MKDVYVVDAVRTPFGKYNGSLAGVRPDDLAAHAVRELLARTPALDPSRIEDVYFGQRQRRRRGEPQRRPDGRPAGRSAHHRPRRHREPAVRLRPRSGDPGRPRRRRRDASIVLAGGVESMTRAPYVLPKSDRPFPAGTPSCTRHLGWRMVNPRMDPQWTIPLGESAELIADKHGISRERQDEFALASHHKAARAQADGLFDAELAPVPVPQRKGDPVDFAADECVRPTPPWRRWPSSSPPSGRPTARSPPGTPRRSTTAPAALLLVDEEGLKATGREPLARSPPRASRRPTRTGSGSPPSRREPRPRQGGRTFADLDVLELNEAFAAQALGCVAEWPEFDPAILNPQGGAIALGHPLAPPVPSRRHRRPPTRPQGKRNGRRHPLHRCRPGPRPGPRPLVTHWETS